MLRQQMGEERWRGGHFEEAIALFSDLTLAPDCPAFLTIPAYDNLTEFV